MKIRIDIQVERWSIDRLIPRVTNPSRKARRGRSRAGQEGGGRCYWLIL
jgi:hypothetical protein